jgi:hypothetical protein
MARSAQIGQKGRDTSSSATAGVDKAICRGEENLHAQLPSNGMTDNQSYPIFVPQACAPLKSNGFLIDRFKPQVTQQCGKGNRELSHGKF